MKTIISEIRKECGKDYAYMLLSCNPNLQYFYEKIGFEKIMVKQNGGLLMAMHHTF